MRWIIGLVLALALTCIAGNAWGASAYQDVPTDHWAYNALDYLSQRGVLEGYPDGFFKGDRTLTRYEFAQAVARLLDSIGQNGGDEQVKIMADSLRAEFSDQLAELGKTVNELGGTVEAQQSQINDLESTVTDTSAKVDALQEKIDCLKPGPEWKGELRYRWQWESRGDNDRFRQRIRFRLGYNAQVNDCTMVGFRLETETGADVTNGFTTLGAKDGQTAGIYLDRAYVKYSPTWFGTYSNCDNDCNSRIDIYAGLMPNITYDPHEMVLDDDVNFQGLGAVYHFNQDFQVLAATSIISEKNTGVLDDDATLCAAELKYNNFLTCGLDAWIGAYCFGNESYLPASYFTNNTMSGFDFNNNGIVGDTGDRMSTQFALVKGGMQYTWNCVWNKPLAIWGEYVCNCQSDAADRVAIVNSLITAPIIFENTDDSSIGFGAAWGEKPTCKGDWYWFGSYKEIGTNAAIDGLADSDAGGANSNSLEVGTQYMFEENSTLGITYFLNKMNNAFGFQIPASKADQTLVQLDWTFKF